MNDDINFSDMFALTKISVDSVVEKFGAIINSSFFDAANILGGLKLNGLIDFGTTLGSQNPITITDKGKELLAQMNARINEPMDKLDSDILNQLSNGKRSANDISVSMNVMHKDMGFHLYKLITQGYISAEFRNGILNTMLTEKGFMQAKGVPMPPKAPTATPQSNNIAATRPITPMNNSVPPPPPIIQRTPITQPTTAPPQQPTSQVSQTPPQNVTTASQTATTQQIPELDNQQNTFAPKQSTTAAPLNEKEDIQIIKTGATTSKLPYILVIIAVIFLIVVLLFRFKMI